MRRIHLGLVGYGTVGSGLVKLIKMQKTYLKDKYGLEFVFKIVCDRSIQKKDTSQFAQTVFTTDYKDVLKDPEVEVVIELIGGTHPAKEIITGALQGGKHVVTANKELIANHGRELFQLAQQQKRHFYFESSVGAGIPIIKYITEGIAGNKFKGLYGIINGTCNFILSEMRQKNCSFADALKEAQEKGYAESDPTLDINGMDSAHKLAILVYLTFGKFVNLKDIYTEGITRISQEDIEYAERLNLCIKLLAIAKKTNDMIEARVHPTLISKEHPLASINGIYNAIYLDTVPLGNNLLCGEGAGQMSAASGVFSDLINLGTQGENSQLLCNIFSEAIHLQVKQIDEVETRFYIRFNAIDKPGTLAKIAGILGDQGIGINSVTQQAHNKTFAVPVIMLTDYTPERNLRLALEQISHLSIVKSKPVAIRMEKL